VLSVKKLHRSADPLKFLLHLVGKIDFCLFSGLFKTCCERREQKPEENVFYQANVREGCQMNI